MSASTPNSYNEYVDCCKDFFHKFKEMNPTLHCLYLRDRKGKRCGVVIKYISDDAVVRYGWSLYNSKLESKPFSRYVALSKAIRRSNTLFNITKDDGLPHAARKRIVEMNDKYLTSK